MTDIRLATLADRERLVTTVVAAFDRDPAFRVFFGADPEFSGLAARFAGSLLDRRILAESVWMTDDGDALAMWDPPQGTDDVPMSSPALPDAVQTRIDDYDRQVHAAITTAPHWYLGVLASHPQRRGEGLARRVAEPGLAAAAASCVPAVLETSNAANVALYERSGWSVVASLTDVVGLTVWVLERR